MTSSASDLQRAAARLVIAWDGDEWVLGRPDVGIFVSVPEAGRAFVEALRADGSLVAATASASELAGEPVDGEDFLATLQAAGLLDERGPGGHQGPPGPVRGRQIRWIERVSPNTARRLFGKVAWTAYLAAAVAAATILVLRPDFLPSYENAWFVTDPVMSSLLLLAIAVFAAILHEGWHFLAGRALGVPAVFRVSQRGMFVVFETDLAQLVTLPRRRRYGPMLAGLAIDCCVLSAALIFRLLYHEGVLTVPPLADRVVGAVVLVEVVNISWQWVAVFLRTDGYAVLANALRCQNLYRTTTLTAKNRLIQLAAEETAELADASQRDRRIASWLSAFWLLNVVAIISLYVTLIIPSVLSMATWVGQTLATGALTTAAFWQSVVMAACLLVFYGSPPLLALRERRLRRAGVLR